MKKNLILTLGVACVALSTALSAGDKVEQAKPNGEYRDWRLLSVSHRNDNKTLRAILGNDIAIKAARDGKTKPWPDGAVLAKVVWKASQHPNWAEAVVPGGFAAAEAMIKDSKKYASRGGWGFAHWQGDKLVMHDEKTADKCIACHTPVKGNDYVYTFNALQ